MPAPTTAPSPSCSRNRIATPGNGQGALTAFGRGQYFPEGGIRSAGQSVLDGNPVFKPGAGSIALLGGASILPVIVRDTRKPYAARNWFRRETMSITFGQPFCLWTPARLPAEERRRRTREMLREQLLKTVELR